jgi:tetratricopeptide (TPR) repeat protein
MTTRTILLALTASMAAQSLAAQQGGYNLRLAEAQQKAKYTPPLCPLKPVNAKVEKSVGLLRKAYDAKTPADRAASLDEAKKTIVAAITQEAQGGNAAAWYYLARVALMQGDPAGADSAFTKAQDLVPSCEIDITQYRQNNWAMLANAALKFQREGQSDSALALFRDASLLFRGLPHVYSNMGVVFANSGHEDSAAVYFQKALTIAEKDTALTEDRNVAALNLAIMYQRTNRHPEAVAMLHKYLAWKPDDIDAKKALAVSFRNAGMADSALAVEHAMVEGFAKTNLDSLDLQDLLAVGVAAFNAGKYPDAANAFSKAVKRNPWSRDSRYNLANTYLAMKDYQNLIDETTKLIEIEPMNEDALRLLAQGQRNLKQDDAVLKTAERLVALPFSVEVNGFQMSAAGAKFTGEAVGRTAQDINGKPIKTGPMTLVLEFVDVNGTAVDSKEIAIPVLAKDAKHPIEVEGKGAGIVGWRYHAK